MTDDESNHRPLYWGPGGPPDNRELVESWTPGTGSARTWGAYHQVLFPPRKTTPWIRFKTMTTGADIAVRLWDEREAQRVDYEGAHGNNPDSWPVRHLGIVLESVQWVAHAACLGCQWLETKGTSMKQENWRIVAAEIAWQHQHLSA